MYKLSESTLDWSLLHLINFYDSDFFPRLFEFSAIKHDWRNVKDFLLSLDLSKYAPKTPIISLAPKHNNTFRVVHQLDPIDSIIYTSLAFDNAKIIEDRRIAADRKIACSYRIATDANGSFFKPGVTGYVEFQEKAFELLMFGSFKFVVVCDIVDFYNQIYLHRVSNILSEAGSVSPGIVESFLTGLNTNVSKGIPVGPAPSILLAEAIMSDIDRKILATTDNFTRYVDDMYVFFKSEYDAKSFLHDLTRYLHSNHRLVLSSEKTKIVAVHDFASEYFDDDDSKENEEIVKKLRDLRTEEYPSSLQVNPLAKLEPAERLKVRSEAYVTLFQSALSLSQVNVRLLRHILRQAGVYGIRSLTPLILENFERLFPVLREVVIYLEKVLNARAVAEYRNQFAKLLESPYLSIPFINLWVTTLFQLDIFNEVDLKVDYRIIQTVRGRALIARRQQDKTWVKDHKDIVDSFGLWDRRAILFASSVLSEDEAKHWLALEKAKGDLLSSAICSMLLSQVKR